MKVYQLHIAPSDADGEGEDHDEWFSSLKAARARRAELIAEDPQLEGHAYGVDFKIEVHEVRPLPRRELVLALLNRRGCFFGGETVVPDYSPRRDDVETTMD